jgi:ArsR family transcriptional regulator, nickel/cobalt-responsive transcriptional repressor
VPHAEEHNPVGTALTPNGAESLAESMRAFGAGSRLRLLWSMLDGERTVEELAELTGLAPSATSQQLRLLRQGRLVAVRRAGRHAYYRLHDHHVGELLAAIRHHHEHLELPQTETPPLVNERAGIGA